MNLKVSVRVVLMIIGTLPVVSWGQDKTPLEEAITYIKENKNADTFYLSEYTRHPVGFRGGSMQPYNGNVVVHLGYTGILGYRIHGTFSNIQSLSHGIAIEGEKDKEIKIHAHVPVPRARGKAGWDEFNRAKPILDSPEGEKVVLFYSGDPENDFKNCVFFGPFEMKQKRDIIMALSKAIREAE